MIGFFITMSLFLISNAERFYFSDQQESETIIIEHELESIYKLANESIPVYEFELKDINLKSDFPFVVRNTDFAPMSPSSEDFDDIAYHISTMNDIYDPLLHKYTYFSPDVYLTSFDIPGGGLENHGPFRQTVKTVAYWNTRNKPRITNIHADTYQNTVWCHSGEKIFLLWPKHEYSNLYISDLLMKQKGLPGFKRRPNYLFDTLDVEKYPAVMKTERYAVKLKKGDVLHLPSTWFHHVYTLENTLTISYWNAEQRNHIVNGTFQRGGNTLNSKLILEKNIKEFKSEL